MGQTAETCTPVDHDSKECRHCGHTDFKYQNLGAMVRRVCQTPGCEAVMNGQLAHNLEVYPFLRGNVV